MTDKQQELRDRLEQYKQKKNQALKPSTKTNIPKASKLGPAKKVAKEVKVEQAIGSRTDKMKATAKAVQKVVPDKKLLLKSTLSAPKQEPEPLAKVVVEKLVTEEKPVEIQITVPKPNITDSDIFKNRIKLFGMPKLTLLNGQEREKVNLSRMLLFSLFDAIEQAEKGNQEVARAIFTLLSETKLKEGHSYFYYHKKWVCLNKPFTDQVQFWVRWAEFEEKCGNLNGVADVYFDAIDQLKDRNEVMLLRQEYYAFQARVGVTKREIEVEDVEAPPELQSEERDIDAVIEKSKPVELEEWDDFVKTEPVEIVKKGENVVNDIVEMLGAMTIKTEAKPKPELDFVTEIPKQHKTPGRKLIGVPVSARKGGSNVTVLTPVKASRKTKNELGVDQVITPVRRSLRLFNDSDYQPDNQESEKAPTRDKVARLLESHGYAYVPNKNVEFKLDMIRNRNDLEMSTLSEENDENELL